MVEAVLVTGPADKLLHFGVPGCDIIVGDRPLDAEAVTSRSVKIIATPALATACPDKRFPTLLIAPDPVERLLLDVGLLLIFHKEVLSGVVERIALGDDRIFLEDLLRHPAGVL